MNFLEKILLSSVVVTGLEAAVIDIPITFRNIHDNYLQTAYDNAQEGDTLRYVKVDQADYPGNLVADDEKKVNIDLNDCRMDGSITLTGFTESSGLTISDGMLYTNEIQVYGSADLTLDSFEGVRFNDNGLVQWYSSGDLVVTNGKGSSYNQGTGTLINVVDVIGNTTIDVSRNNFRGFGDMVVIGDETYAESPMVNITHNTVDSLTNALVFKSDLSKTTGEVSNNAYSRLSSFVINPLYAKRFRVMSNNIFDYEKIVAEDMVLFDSEEMLMSLLSEELFGSSIIDTNYFYNPEFVNMDYWDYHLTQQSQLIDRGIDFGQSYLGIAPDIGAFESTYTREPIIPEPSTVGLLMLPMGYLLTKRLNKKNE